MKTNRIRNIRPAISGREAMESVVGEIAAIMNRQRILTAAMDAQIQAVREQYEGQLATDSEMLDRKIEEVRLWSEANPNEFGSARSLDAVHGTIGWRSGPPSLKTVAGWTFDRVLQALKNTGATGYIRVKEEVNKQHLLSDRELIGPEKLREIGLRVVQDEAFYVDPKLTEVEA